MGWTSPEAQEIFQWFVVHEAERRKRDREKVSEALQTLPASQATLDELSALSPDDAERALHKHPGYPGHRKIESVRTMLELFRRALADLAQAIAEFPELGGPETRISRERLEQDLSIRVNKELFAALGAAKTLVDYSRRIKDLVNADLFETKRNAEFHPGEHAFIMELRNSVLHQVHSWANWRKVWSAGTKSTHFVIKREDLLADRELSNASREYLDHLGSTCDVTKLLQGYSERVDRFYRWLLPEVESHLPQEVMDYRACLRAVKRRHGNLSYEVMIGLWTQTGADPYQHLSKLLTSEQVKEMEALPHRSSQQVDYIISCLDNDQVCDDHLRAIVYKFFNVNSSREQPADHSDEKLVG
jgi:hypothetical protein